jgi:uncharacterized protein YkwD
MRPSYGLNVDLPAARSPSGFALRALVGVSAVAALLALLVGVRPAPAAPGLLAGANAACPGADDMTAPEAVQRQAVVCLVNLARSRADRARLGTPRKLRKAAALKGRVVVSCGQLSHTPCGAEPTAAVQRAGYRYAWFGENLWLGTWGAFTPHQVVESWLASTPHRANILRTGFTDFGVARVRANGVFGEPSTAVWVATFASPLGA